MKPLQPRQAVALVLAVIGLALTGCTVDSPSPAQGGNADCDPNYPEACLKDGVGDYDCAGGSGNGPNYTGRVKSVGGDPFGLDGDGDGWGCE